MIIVESILKKKENQMKSYRIFGLLGILSSLVILPYMMNSMAGDTQPTLLTSVLGLIFQLGGVCSAIGMYQTRATGNSVAGKTVLIIQIVLHSLASIFQVIEYQQLGVGSLLWTIIDIGWPFGFLFMWITGSVVAGVGRWTGWRRIVPLLCGLPIVIAALAGGVASEQVAELLFPGLLTITYLLLGFALFSYNEEARKTMFPTSSPNCKWRIAPRRSYGRVMLVYKEARLLTNA